MKPTKSFLENNLKSAIKQREMHKEMFYKNAGIAEFIEEMIKNGFFVEDDKARDAADSVGGEKE